MSPSKTPSICISPLVVRFPFIVRSEDRTEGAAFGLGAEEFSISELGLFDDFESTTGGEGIVAEDVVVGSTGLGFENIFLPSFMYSSSIVPKKPLKFKRRV